MKLPKKYWRKHSNAWYVNVGDKKVLLGKTEAEADAEYAKLFSLQLPQGDPITAHKLLDEFWKVYSARKAASTVKNNRPYLEGFKASLPPILPAKDVRPYHIEQYVATTKNVANNSIASRYRFLSSIFNWGRRSGYLAENPVADIIVPPGEPSEHFLPHRLWKPILECTSHIYVRMFIRFMLETGCRAEEMFKMQCEWYDPESKRVQFPIAKSKGASRRPTPPRIIYLNTAANTIAKRCVKVWETGPMFRNSQGRVWERSSIRKALGVVMEAYNLWAENENKQTLTTLYPTMFRHSFAHYRISIGTPIPFVAKLMGHKSTQQLYQRYGHLEQGNLLRDAIDGKLPGMKRKKKDDAA